ncbi:MAG: ComEC family competence protein [Planctomycetaceae bacterium]|nr:ComEC family competence protein [Planctomycetaceae bacterium]
MLACRPMLCFAVAVMTGIILARYWPGGVGLVPFGWLLFLALFLWFSRSRERTAPEPNLPEGYANHILARPGWVARRGLNRFILIACFGLVLLGMMRQDAWRRSREAVHLPERHWFDAMMEATAPVGDVASGARWRTSVRLLTVDGVPLAKPIPLRVLASNGEPVRRGDFIKARLRLYDESPRAYPGAFDFAFFLERDGLVGTAEVVQSRRRADKPSMTVIPNRTMPWHIALRRLVDDIRFAAIDATLRYGGDQRGMLAAMLFGYRSDMDADVRDSFRRVGIGHVLAISGLHVGLVVWLLWWCCGWLSLPRRPRAAACLVLALFYLGLTGGQVAATRATVMAVIYLAGVVHGRKGDMLNSLGAAAFLLALLNPTAPMDVSFQLSFTAVIFIYIALTRPGGGDERPRQPPLKKRSRYLTAARRQLVSLTRLSVATWLGLYPIIAMVFNQVNVMGLPINIVVIPLMGVVLGCGLLLPVLGWIPGVAWVLTAPARLLTTLAVWADQPAWWSSFAAHAPSGMWVAVFFAFVGVYMLRGMLPAGKSRTMLTAASLSGVVIGLVGVTLSMGSLPPPVGGRLTLMPGAGLGVVVAESPGGGMALIGTMRRGGLNEAGWLHHLHRGGTVSVVAIGKTTQEDMAPLAYHYPITTFATLPLTRTADVGATTDWQAVDGVEGVEFALHRDHRGRVDALAVRAGAASLCVVPSASVRGMAAALHRFFPDGPPGIIAPTLLRATEAPTGAFPCPVAVKGRADWPLPEGWFYRNEYGVLVVRESVVTGYDGSSWRMLPRRSASVSSATDSASLRR